MLLNAKESEELYYLKKAKRCCYRKGQIFYNADRLKELLLKERKYEEHL